MAVAMSCTSCIREDLDQCPPLSVDIEVKDKNYANVEQVDIEEEEDENQPFSYFVPTLYYRLSRLNADGTKQMVTEKGVFTVEGKGLTYPVSFAPDLPFGKYIFTVWGGMSTLDEFNADRTEVSFHPDHAQGDDVYLASDTLDYEVDHHDFTSQLRRTKGKLIIYAEDLPRRINYSGKTVTELFGTVDTKFIYDDETMVKTHNTRRAGGNILTETFLTPSISEKSSVLDANFYDDDNFDHPDISPADVKITMHRNELTVMKYVYDAQDNVFRIYTKVNNNWEAVHDMILE